MTQNKSVLDWIENMKALVTPDNVVWITGEEAQLEELRCTTVSGTVTARGFSAEELEFASDSGSLEL